MRNHLLNFRRKNGSPVYLLLAPFTPEQKAEAESLQKQIDSLGAGEHPELQKAVEEQATKLLVAASARAAPDNPNPSAQVDSAIRGVGFKGVWSAVMESAAKGE